MKRDLRCCFNCEKKFKCGKIPQQVEQLCDDWEQWEVKEPTPKKPDNDTPPEGEYA